MLKNSQNMLMGQKLSSNNLTDIRMVQSGSKTGLDLLDYLSPISTMTPWEYKCSAIENCLKKMSILTVRKMSSL